MTVNNLASELCKLEKGKSEIKIGDMREALKILSKKIYDDPEIMFTLWKNGQRLKKTK